MNRRTQAKLRLQKISQNSSPASKKQQNLKQISSGRLIPFASTTISPSPKKNQSTKNQKNQQLNVLRQEIMDRRQKLTSWEDAFSHRQNGQVKVKSLTRTLASGLAKLSQHPDIRLGYLRAIKRGRKGILLWLLTWLNYIFSMIRMIIAQRNLQPL